MKHNKLILIIAFICLLANSCGTKSELSQEAEQSSNDTVHEKGEDTGSLFLSNEKFRALDMKVGALPLRNIAAVVEASGQLEVPPQNEAIVTAILGANVTSIKVIEGDDVKKGQALAYLSHPNLTKLQSEYLDAFSNMQYLEKEYERQQKLYEEKVGSGKNFQQAEASYQAKKAMVKSYESQLRQLGLSPSYIQKGNLYDQVPVVSPIEGSVTKVDIKTGQYVPPEKDLFEIVNTHHIHADLMVFEKDVYKVEKGQRVRFRVETLPGQELLAEIYSVGKKFEQNPKAVHVHAEIENTTGKLIPGMYIKGQILTDSVRTFALPEDAITQEGEDFLAFMMTQEKDTVEGIWNFVPVQVMPGVTGSGWTEVKFMEEIPDKPKFALNNAYYLAAEMSKGEAEHSH